MAAKIHYFQCRNSDSGNNPTFTNTLQDMTCGQCKGMILETVRASDWNKLPQEVVDYFYKVADYLSPR